MPSPPTEQPLVVSSRIRIPAEELRFSFVRSSGPGGQNVNKVNTKAVLRWSLAETTALGDAVRTRFLESYGHRITVRGDLVITSQRHREQGKNAADCLEKLRTMIAQVATPPKKRKPTRPTKGAVKRRLDAKRQRSEKKERRRYEPE